MIRHFFRLHSHTLYHVRWEYPCMLLLKRAPNETHFVKKGTDREVDYV